MSPLWKESAFETHRRRSRLLLLGPLGVVSGLVYASLTYTRSDVPLLLLAPVASTVGLGVMYLVAQLETFLRLRGRAEHGRRALFTEVAVDVLGGSLTGGAFANVLGIAAPVAIAAGAAIVTLASYLRRVFLGGEIEGLVRSLSADARTGSAPDYARERELLARGEIDQALALFDKRSEEQGGHASPVLVDAAQILRDRGLYQQAVEYYRKAMDVPDMDSRRASIFAKQIWDLHRRHLKPPAAAIPHLEALVERYPESSDVDWAWRELTVGMVVTEAALDHLGAHAHVPAVKAVERILSEAFITHASDIHLEDYADGLRVRYRIDGLLQDAPAPPSRIRNAVLARIRVMAGLNPAESPVPQDARIRVPFAGRDVDIRVSTMPTLHGQSVALRVLDTAGRRLQLEELGLRHEDLQRLLSVVERPNGMVLATGPGGSGKSTTLHAVVERISTGKEKIFTVEDPIEFALDGVCQVSVNHKAGLTFARLLRSLIRQDPDVLLIGEIRDTETAEIATHASLTGHLVLSTLHTTDAISALHRLVDIGVPDYMVVHTLEGAMAQTLVRRVCTHCAEQVDLAEGQALALGSPAEELTHAPVARGCERCRGTGYKGRIGLFELLLVNEPLRQAFLEHSPRRELMQIACDNGMHTLRADGIDKIRSGITTPEEVLRVTRSA